MAVRSVSTGHRTVIVSIVSVVALAVAIGLGSQALGGLGEPGARVDQDRGTTDWPRNESGLTYGSAAEAQSPDDEPDLILAYATNGELGYVKRTDLVPPSPSSPEEALARQEAMGDGTEEIPVYEVDGVTQIGVFIIHYGDEGVTMTTDEK